MLLDLRNKKNELVVKDILDIDFDMSVKEENDKFYVMISKQYREDEEYDTLEEAEAQVKYLSKVRNQLEQELRNF